jgi:tetratricopeptide (TPR) repeat protein
MASDAAHGPDPDITADLRRAIGLVATDPAEAEALARRVLAARPNDPDATAVLSGALRTRGDTAGALAVIEPLAARQARGWVVRYEWAQVLVALGRSRDAVEPLTAATGLNPRLAAAWRLLGDIRLMAGDARAAQIAYDRQLGATMPDARLAALARALSEGRIAEAESELRAALTANPDALAPAHLLAEVLARRGELVAAEALLAHCLERAPNLGLARLAHALVLDRAGKPEAALAEFDRVLARDPANVRARAARAAALTSVGDYAAAVEITSALAAAFPDQAHAWTIQANGLRMLGRIDEAVAAWRRAIALQPERGEPYWGLANLKAYRFSEAERAAMSARSADPATSEQDRALLAFALGKADEDAGRFAEAFAHYAAGNALERRRRGYDADATTALVRRAKALFTPEFFERRAGCGDASTAPIFIVGLPRSGSTLVEQILASHPDVESTAELMDIQAMADWAGALPAADGRSGYPDRLAALPREAIAQLGHDYLARTAPRRRLGRARFIDKAPWNWLHAGLIQLILPGAKIVDVRRHPLGCGFSAFKQHFAGGFDFAYDLTDLGRYYADYVTLMAHFDAATPGRVHRVSYEALVADTETEVRRLLDYLALPFDAATLRFHENRRAVSTPSSEQVRRPIYADGVDSWRRFDPWLDPLKAALGPVLETYPAPP